MADAGRFPVVGRVFSRTGTATSRTERLTGKGKLLVYALLVGGAIVVLLPFGYMIGTALNPERWIMPFPPSLFPDGATLANFDRAWNEAGLQRYMFNSAVVASVTVVLTLAVSTTSAFAFARLQFPAKEYIFGLYLITMMIPDMIALLPKFQVMRDFGLTNSWSGLWVIYVANAVAFNTFLLRAFFQQVPRDLEDAALIDGGGAWVVFRRIMLPLTKPALATVAVFTFLGAWDDFWWARLLLQDADLRTLPIGIALFFNAHGTQWSTVFAATTLAVIPEIVVFVLLQRYFVSGLYAGAVRG
jgi:multiple sugar transport system permease protein